VNLFITNLVYIKLKKCVMFLISAYAAMAIGVEEFFSLDEVYIYNVIHVYNCFVCRH